MVYQNQYVRILDVRLNSGESTLFYTHSHDSIAVRLSEAVVQRQHLGNGWQPASKVMPGSVSYTEGGKTPYIHRVKDIGKTRFHVIDVELLQ